MSKERLSALVLRIGIGEGFFLLRQEVHCVALCVGGGAGAMQTLLSLADEARISDASTS